MQQKSSNKRLNLWMLLGSLTLIICVLGSLGIVWVRQQVAVTASRTKQLEQVLSKAERKQQYLASKIAEVNQPSYLKARVAGVLDLPNENAIVWADLPAGPASSKTSLDPALSEPFALSLDLAFLATAMN